MIVNTHELREFCNAHRVKGKCTSCPLIKECINTVGNGTLTSYIDNVEKIFVAINGCQYPLAHWVIETDTKSDWWCRTKYYCTACGKWTSHGESNFCPNCGARMEVSGR